MGRPCKYKTHVRPRFDEILGWYCAGSVDEKVAKALGISLVTFYAYIEKHPKFAALVAMGKSVADDAVEAALFKRGIGYEYTETRKREVVRDAEGLKIVTTITRHIPGNVAAQILWLKNRRPEQWKVRRGFSGVGDMPPIRLFDVEDAL